MADQGILNLIRHLEQLITQIEKAKGATSSFDTITLSDSIPAQLRDQISLVRRLEAEYRNLMTTYLKGGKVPAMLPSGIPTAPREPLGARFDPSVSRYRTSGGTFTSAPPMLDAKFDPRSGRYVSQISSQFVATGAPPYVGQPLLPATTTTGQQPMVTPSPAPAKFTAHFSQVGRESGKVFSKSFSEAVESQALPDDAGSRILGLKPGDLTGTAGVEDDAPFDETQLRSIESRFQSAADRAKKYGFEIEHLQGVHTEASTGISRLTYQMKDEDGVLKDLSISVDKYGNVLKDSQKRFRSFGDTIARNIREVAKWTIAIQLIYGPMRKFSELMTLMVDNESKLADIAVAVGDAHNDMASVFQVASDVAKETGESINGVLDGYELAYRATGSYADETERLAVTQQLLYDSMVLSKLSTLDQAEALDTLVGALKQTGRGLDEGQELIDKWVALARVANVSVETLAESFAITATAAQSAGLSFEELNGIIAVVAENTTLSATEAGNAVRGFIAGVQADSAVKELEKYGIFIKDATGGTLGFYDALRLVKEQADAGLISSSQFNEISLALGGQGARRGAQMAATIKNLGDVQEYAAVQTDAHGAAQEALDIKLEIVRTKLTELSNAFVSLAQSLGNEGGLLDAFKVMAELVTSLVDGITTLSETLGSALPMLAAFAITYNQLASNQRFAAMGIGGAGLFSGLAGMKENVLRTQVPFTAPGGTTYGRDVGSYLRPGSRIPGIALGAAATGLNVALNISQGETLRAGGNIAGAVIGGLLTGGNPIGIVIGSAIGDTFVQSVLEYEPTLEEFFKELFPKPEDTGRPGGGDTAQSLEQEIIQQAGFFGTEFGGNIATAITMGITNASSALWSLVPSSEFGRMESVTRGQAALAMLPEDERAEYIQRLKDAREAEQLAAGETQAETVSTRQTQIYKDNIDLLVQMAEEYKNLSREQLLAGEIGAKAFKDQKDEADGFANKVSSFGAVFGDAMIQNIDGINNMSDALEVFGDIVVNTTEEEESYLRELAASINTIMNELENPEKFELNAEEQAFQIDTLNEHLRDAVDYIDALNNRPIDIQLPQVVNLQDITRSRDLDAIIDEAQRLQQEYFQAGLDLGLFPEGTIMEDLMNTLEPVMIQAGGDLGFTLAENLSSQFISTAEGQLAEAGDIIPANLGLKTFPDLGRADLVSAAEQSLTIVDELKKLFPEYDPNIETFIGVAEDGIAGPIVAEMAILEMLTRDLIDVNEKQLEGIYNLPTDASFYVPFTGYEKGFGGGGGGGGGLSPEQILEMLKDAMLLEQPEREAPAEDIFTKYADYFETVKPFEPLGPPEPPGFEAPDTDYYTKDDFPAVDALEKTMEKTFGKSTDESISSTLNEINNSLSQAEEVTTNFNLDITSSTFLQLDSQLVAESVKQYVANELIKQQATTTITRGVVL